ncbi:hypothetical protein C1H46_030275 [Malus baccata]|uniref:Uncharacterized protein n=1 Tax=Malus baccata TaxID=106549 RepID=A0A540LCI5_MALBA|nr:hypothetical protein C1H46_030275 [Malus baccata]
MRAFRFADSIRQLFKKLTGARAGDASAVAEEPNVNVEYDISPSHPKHHLILRLPRERTES